MASIAISPESIAAHQDLRQGNSRYIILKLNAGNTKVIVEKTAPLSSKYDEFLADLPQEECRFGIYNYEHKSKDESKSKIIFIRWFPEAAKVKDSMMYASCVDKFKRGLDGVPKDILASVMSDLEEANIRERI
ncbi:Cofilin [Dactylellina cionopaga]|nr:Cofilin [Dactylellina cionopaga]